MENQTVVGPDKNLYLYCLFKGHSSPSPQRGIDGANDTFVLAYQDLCALVSPVSIDEYNEQTLNRKIEDLGWLVPRVNLHDQIIRRAMELCSVIPLRFATMYKTADRLLEALKSGYGDFCSFLDFIGDKEEWGVKVYARQEADRKIIESANEPIEQLDKRLAAATPGEAYLLRKKRKDLVRQQSVGLLNSFSGQVYQQLSSGAIEARRNKLLSRGATGKEGDMILNAAFLIKKLEVENFKGRVDALAASYERDALSFEISGPWPCYSFCPDFKV